MVPNHRSRKELKLVALVPPVQFFIKKLVCYNLFKNTFNKDNEDLSNNFSSCTISNGEEVGME